MKGKIYEQPTPPENISECLIVCYKPELKECLLPLRPTSELNLRDADASSSSAFGRTTFLELMSWTEPALERS
ncbi:hypothetical protein DY000_02044455 [Brassica cretica]|uniref:Uncharacterized protein n=1 Tax=Brassica cretica TaxID=69181 RepID=A0ABQ7EWJ6_BRACR|nr:hypothetical protein DY000_02044455 [Brassica cretica]